MHLPDDSLSLHDQGADCEIYSDNVNGVRTLSGGGYDDAAAMTEESCISYCSGQDFIYAGVEYGDECCKSKAFVPSWCCSSPEV
jgi:hypothetical protein